jgi:hypothetical protein
MRSTLILAAVALATPVFAEDAAAPTTTTTLPGHRGYKMAPGDDRGLPTGVPGFSSPPMPMEEKKPGHEPQRDAR